MPAQIKNNSYNSGLRRYNKPDFELNLLKLKALWIIWVFNI